MKSRTRGFTLIELMVTLVLLGMLAMLAYPSFANYLQSAQVRAAAESVLAGLQLARAESIRRNAEVQLRLLNTQHGEALAGGTDWEVNAADPDLAGPPEFTLPVQKREEDSRGSPARLGATAGPDPAAAGAGLPANIRFTGLGRLSIDTTVRQIDVTGAGGARPLRIRLSPGGEVRMCDPAVALADNPQGCQ